MRPAEGHKQDMARALSHGRVFTKEEIWENYTHFIKQVATVAEENSVRIGIHPDDPPVPVLAGVPRCIFSNFEGYRRALEIAASPNVGICLCCGTWLEGGKQLTGKDPEEMTRYFGASKIWKIHFRNVSAPLPHFVETFMDDGYYDMYKIMKGAARGCLRRHRYPGPFANHGGRKLRADRVRLRLHARPSQPRQCRSESVASYTGMSILSEELVPLLIDAIDVKRRTRFELDNVPYACLEVEVNTPTARGGQTLVRIKMRNLITNAVFDRTFKAGEKFKEPDLQTVSASYLYSDADGSYFLDQESFETLTLAEHVIGSASDFLVEGGMVELLKFNGNPIGLELPPVVELTVSSTEPGVRGDSSSGSVTKPATLETGLELRVPLFIKEGEKVRVSTETREFSGRA